jgi:type IV pilus assembly protein PilA
MHFGPRAVIGGFTRIEAVVVVGVTALLGAAGVSSLRTHLVRIEIAESVELARYARDRVARTFRRTGTPPADAADAGLSMLDIEGGPYIAETRIVDGRIDLVFGADANQAIAGRTLSLTPFETADRQVVWSCGSASPGLGLKPLGFAGGSRQPARATTTIEPRYLPASCR